MHMRKKTEFENTITMSKHTLNKWVNWNIIYI